MLSHTFCWYTWPQHPIRVIRNKGKAERLLSLLDIDEGLDNKSVAVMTVDPPASLNSDRGYIQGNLQHRSILTHLLFCVLYPALSSPLVVGLRPQCQHCSAGFHGRQESSAACVPSYLVPFRSLCTIATGGTQIEEARPNNRRGKSLSFQGR